MKRKIVIVIDIILILISFKLLYNIRANSRLINKYNNGEYTDDFARSLTYFNFLQRYVANYNYGNILYQKGEYESAIEEYKKALKGIVPKYKECNIRINYALAICQTVNVNEKDQDSIKSAIKEYETAIEVLTEDGCANKTNNKGHSQKAEQLKKDIQKEIDRLKKLEKIENDSNEEKEENKKDKTKEDVETIESKIQNIKEEATKDQRETESKFTNYNKDINTRTKNW